MAATKGKMSRIGQIWEAKDSTKEVPKFFLRLGQENKKSPQYDLHVEIVVKDAEGNVVTKQTDGYLTLSDPRSVSWADQEALAKVPNLQFDVLVRNE